MCRQVFDKLIPYPVNRRKSNGLKSQVVNMVFQILTFEKWSYLKINFYTAVIDTLEYIFFQMKTNILVNFQAYSKLTRVSH
jgi:hypothetical protein